MAIIERIALKLRRMITRPEERGEYSSGYLPYLARKTVRELIAFKSEGRLLEIGSGEGLFLSEIALNYPGMYAVGVEPWDEILSKARERLLGKGLQNVAIIKGISQNLPFKEGSFDHVVCVNLLNNLATNKDMEETISEMVRVCKKGGSIYFDFRNSLNPITYMVYKLAPLHDPHIKVPLRMHRPKDMERMLKSLGIKRIKLFGIGLKLGRFSTAIVIQAWKDR